MHKTIKKNRRVAQGDERYLDTVEVGGSNPPAPTSDEGHNQEQDNRPGIIGETISSEMPMFLLLRQ